MRRLGMAPLGLAAALIACDAAPVASPTAAAAPTQATGAPPPGFTAATTIGDPRLDGTLAKWALVDEPGVGSVNSIVKLIESRNRGEVFNLLLRDAPAPADLSLSVRLRADRGGDDRGGGLVWRARDENHYYVCRWNPLEKNLRAYRVDAGRRIRLQSVTIDADADAWHALAVRMKGRVIEISFDGRKVISCADPSYTEGGRVGLWTKADAESSFDDLEVGPAD